MHRTSQAEEDAQIGVAIEQWHRLHEWADSQIAAANRVSHAPCWQCGAWMMKPHMPWCGVVQRSADKY